MKGSICRVAFRQSRHKISVMRRFTYTSQMYLMVPILPF